MANNRFVWDGLKELRAALRNLPADLKKDAGPIVERAVDGAADEIRSAYAKKRGNLQRGVKVQKQLSEFGVGAILRSTAPHANLYEVGSQARHTELGAFRGSMPARPTFIPIVVRKRREMWDDLRDLVESQGLTVTGTP